MKKNAILFYYVALDFWWGHHPFKVTRRDRNPYATPINATVTQLDRVLGYELRSREFESLRSHQFALLV